MIRPRFDNVFMLGHACAFFPNVTLHGSKRPRLRNDVRDTSRALKQLSNLCNTYILGFFMNKLLVISGATAVGKTEISIELAKRLDGEIINADSMQVYKKMDIGTAKIRPEEMKGVPHHLFDIVEPTESFDVAEYKRRAKDCIKDIYSREHLPILVGGTGFYIQAVLKDIDFDEGDPDPEIRESLQKVADEEGADKLYEKLTAIDPEAAKSMHPNNIKRVIRALEYHEQTGKLISDHNKEQREKPSPYDHLYAVLTLPREELYNRIDIRVDIMLEEGLVDEVRQLLDSGVSRDSTAMQGLGYKEIAAYLEGECSLDDAVHILKRDTRHFAKRQITWFKREPDAVYFDKTNYDYTSALIDAIIKRSNYNGEKTE